MKRIFKKIVDFIKYPTLWLIILSFFLTAGFISVLVRELIDKQGETDAALHILLFVAGALLAYSIYIFVLLFPKIKKRGITCFFKLPLGTRLSSEAAQRTLAASVISSIISIGYGALNLFLAIYHSSPWHSAVSAYYLALTMVYWLMISSFKRHRGNEIKSYRDLSACGALLFVLSLCLSLAVFQMISNDKYPISSGALLLASGAFAVYKVISAIIKTKQHYQGFDAQMAGISAIRLCSCAVSILALQASLLSYFYVYSNTASLLNGICGALSCMLSFSVSLRLIFLSVKKLHSVS